MLSLDLKSLLNMLFQLCLQFTFVFFIAFMVKFPYKIQSAFFLILFLLNAIHNLSDSVDVISQGHTA